MLIISNSCIGTMNMKREYEKYEGCKTSRNYGTKSRSLLKQNGNSGINTINPHKHRSKFRRKGNKSKKKASFMLKTPLKVLSTQDLTGSVVGR